MSTKLLPVNKMLFVEREQPPPKKADQFGFVLPEKVDMSKHVCVVLRGTSEGSQFEKYIGSKIVVMQNMLDTVEFNKQFFQIISENGVVAIIAESDLF